MSKVEYAYREGWSDCENHGRPMTFREPQDIDWERSRAKKNAPVWTQSPPTKEGWWWIKHRLIGNNVKRAVHYYFRDGVLRDADGFEPTDWPNAWWKLIEDPGEPEEGGPDGLPPKEQG